MKTIKTNYKKNANKLLISLLIVHFSLTVTGATYYVSNAGTDLNSGLSALSAWKTLEKVNAANQIAGDQILLERGSTFYGSITVKNSGTAVSPITFGAYGTGANPVISGYTNVGSWINLGNNIWESESAVSALSSCNMVVINGVNTPKGRYPNNNATNSGYLTYTASSSTYLTCATLTGTPNWTGAEVVIRTSNFTIDRRTITSQSGSSINWATATGRTPENGFGFFIQNDSRTLDQQNEWYFNPTTKKISIYSSSEPVDVKVASVDKLIDITKNYITIDGIDFTGANQYAISHNTSDTPAKTYIKVQNCNISFCGITGVYLRGSHISYINNSVSNCHGSALLTTSSSSFVDILNNDVSNIGVHVGQATLFNAIGSGNYTNNVNIEGNSIVNVGFNGIAFHGTNVLIKNNFIDTFCQVLDDGGGIYTYTGSENVLQNVVIDGNVIVNGVGAPEGTKLVFPAIAAGIYCDNNSENIEIKNNSIYRARKFGLHLNDANTINVHHNTVFDTWETQNGKTASQFKLTYPNNLQNDSAHIQIDSNIFVSKELNQYAIDFFSYIDLLIPKFGVANNNIYARPIDDTKTIYADQPSEWSGAKSAKTLEEWKSFSFQDVNSKKSPQPIVSKADMIFEYNQTNTTKTVNLNSSMIDIKGTKYSGSITLQPFSSAVLIKDNNPVKYLSEYKSICEGSSYNGWTTTGKYERILITKSGNDSIVTTYLTVNPKYSVSEDITINEGEAYNGWTESGKYTRNLTSVSGCDSIVTTNLMIENLIIKQGSIPPTHFIPVWNGENGLNHMNIMVVSADLEDLPLAINDEIAVFSGSKCVGSMRLSKTISPDDNSSFLTIPASQDDGSGNGFTINDTIVFKIWDNKNQQEMIAKAVVYKNNVSSWLTGGKYVAGATSVVEIVSYTEYSQTIQLKKGYNMISTFVSAQNPMACHVTQSLADAGYLTKLQDEAGNSLENWGSFGGWVNNIGNLEKTEGYKIKVTDNCALLVTGRPIALPLDIPLKSGWNIISFPRTDLVNAMNIIQPLIDQNKLIKVQDEAGNSIENWGIFGGWKNGIGYFTPGKAYKVKMNTGAVLAIQENYLKSAVMLASKEQTEYFSTEVEGNGSEHVNINIVGIGKAGIVAGDELAAFDGDICVGVLKVTENHIIDGSASLVASISSDTNTTNDGYTEGHDIKIIAWNKLTGNESEVQADVINGQLKYAKNSSVLLNIKSLTTDVRSFQDMVTVDVFPNPSQGMVTVRFSNFPDAGSSIEILDISGRKVASRVVTGMSEVFNLDQQPAGVYLVKSKLGSKETINKLVIN